MAIKPTTRKVVHRAPQHTVRRLHPSYLQARPIEADSALEYLFAYIALLFHLTVEVVHQPFKFVLGDRVYTPDFLVIFRDLSRLLVEVKPEFKVLGYAGLFDRVKEELKGKEVPFLVACDKQIELDNLGANALLIRRYGKTSYPVDICARAIELVQQRPEGIRVRHASETEQIPPEVFLHLVARRQLMLDSSFDVGEQARVFPINQIQEKSHAIQFAERFNFEIW